MVNKTEVGYQEYEGEGGAGTFIIYLFIQKCVL